MRAIDGLVRDLRYAVRVLRRSPGFTATTLLTIAIGIGATTAVFSVVYGVLLRPLPYPAADRIVRLSEEHPGAASPLRDAMLSNLTYHQWALSPRTIEAMAAYRRQEVTAQLPDGPARLVGSTVTPSLFPLLGTNPQRGRLFRDGEGRTGADRLVVLSDGLWRDRFGADPAAIGRTIRLDDDSYEIVGVAPAGFSFPDRETLFWTPYDVPPPAPDAVAGMRGSMTVLDALARLKPDVTPEQASAEGTAAARATIRPMAANLLFGTGGPVVVHVRGVVDEITARLRPALLVMTAGVLLLLLIACANVANLFLSRGVARQRELTVRAAIGAERADLVRQLLAESALLSALGGLLGLATAWALVQVTRSVAWRGFPRLDDVRLDARAVAFAAAATAFAAIASGLAPAWRGTRFDLAASLHGGDGASAGGFRGARAQRLRRALLVAEAALSILLVIGAALLGRSFASLVRVDAGYTPAHVLTAQVFVPGADAAARAGEMQTVVSTLVEQARALPGVAAAGAGNMVPLDNATLIGGFPVPGEFGKAHPKIARSLLYTVTPGYAEALGLRLKSGRTFTTADLNAGIHPWIVNEEFARLYLPANPIGYRFAWGAGDHDPFTCEIVGIVGNVLKNGNDAKPQPEIYEPARDGSRLSARFELVLRAGGDPAALAPAVRRLVSTTVPTAAVETAMLSQRVSDSMDEPRFAATVLAAFAAIALVLAGVGLYGVLSFGVSQRRRELGVRSALGADARALVGLILRDGLAVTTVGIAIGLAGAAALTRLMQSALFGITPLDPVSFGLAPIVLLAVATAACLLPARRAAAVDPAEALRAE